MQSGPLLILNGTVNVHDGQWHHVVGVYDGREGRLYVDGIVDASQAMSGSIATNTFPVWIGDNSQFPGYEWDGLIDDVRIYDVALSEQEIAAVETLNINKSPADDNERGLIAWWCLDGDASDSAGAHTGTVYGNPVWTTGQIQGALLLDGNGDYVDCGNSSSFNLTDAITVTAWIKVHVFDKYVQAVVNKGDSAWRLQRANLNNIGFHCTMQSGSLLSLNSSVNVHDGQWHHVAGVYDGREGRLYVDGIVDASQAMSGSIAANNFPVWIGANSEYQGKHWNGLIDDVRIYDVALSDQEITELVGE
jgi:hypothetical protein